MSAPTVLLIGFGNPGRRDDGLGPALAGIVESLAIPGVTVDADYQLTVEDAIAISEHDAVIFADAAAVGPAPYSFRALAPVPGLSFSTHHVDPESLLALAEEVSGRKAEGYLLAVRGYVFDEFGEALSEGAAWNLTEAIRFLEPVLRSRRIREAACGAADTPVNHTEREDHEGRKILDPLSG